MKLILSLTALFALLQTSCDKEKEAVNAKNEAAKKSLDKQKDAADEAARDSQKQIAINAEIMKAKIEADKDTRKAQLDADIKKSDAAARAEKSRIDAERK